MVGVPCLKHVVAVQSARGLDHKFSMHKHITCLLSVLACNLCHLHSDMMTEFSSLHLGSIREWAQDFLPMAITLISTLVSSLLIVCLRDGTRVTCLTLALLLSSQARQRTHVLVHDGCRM